MDYPKIEIEPNGEIVTYDINYCICDNKNPDYFVVKDYEGDKNSIPFGFRFTEEDGEINTKKIEFADTSENLN